jgi:hypothetical protein
MVTPYYQLVSCKDKAIHGPYTKASPNTVFASEGFSDFLSQRESLPKNTFFFEIFRSLYNHAWPRGAFAVACAAE